MTQSLLIILYITLGFLGAYICNRLLLQFSASLGIRNQNDVTVRWSNTSKPSLGGVSFYVVFVFFSISYAILNEGEPIFRLKEFSGLFTAGTIAFIMGLADDAYNTRPLLKLAAQILCGLLLIITNTIIQLTGIYFLDAALTVFWVVLLMNSLNMLDNMDGITGTVVLFIIAACIGMNWLLNGVNTSLWTLLNCSMLGALLGFLRYNIHPSKLFMGDAGSQFIGFFVAFITIHNIWNIEPATGEFNFYGLLFIIICFTLPFADTLTVVINRLRKGQSPMVGGKDHTTHHLVYAGLNDKQVWWFFAIISCTSFLLVLAMTYIYKYGNKVFIAAFLPFAILVFVYLFINTLKNKAPDKND